MGTIIKNISGVMVAIGLSIASFFGYQPSQNLGSNVVNYVQAQPFTLAGSGISIGATTIILKSFKDIEGANFAMTDFGTIGYGTLEPATSGREEQISFSGLTQNANGTCTLTGVKNVSFKYPYTQTAGTIRSHPGGTSFVISNTAGFYTQFAAKANDETITGSWSFPAPTTGSNPATKAYADFLTYAGVATSSETNFGGVWLGTALQQASSTDGAPNKPYVLQTKNATSSFANAVTSALKVVVSQNNGKIDPNAIDQTNAYSWSGASTHSGVETFSNKVGIATTSPYAPLSVMGEVVATKFTATSTTATSTFTNIQISNNATTTNLTVSGTCTNCATNGYEVITNTNGSCTFNGGNDCGATATCSAGKKVVGGGFTTTATAGFVQTNGPSGTNAWVFSDHGSAAEGSKSFSAYAICVNQ